MSIQTILNRISSLQRDIQALQRQLTSASSDEASKLGRIAQIKQSITKYTSASMLESKQRDILHLENEIVQSQKKQADLTKRISDKTAELHRNEQELNAERGKEQKKLIESMQRREQEMERRQAQLVDQLRAESRGTDSGRKNPMVTSPEPTYDAFISHASEDKEDLVRPLAEALQKMGFSIWYDEFQLRVGDSLRRSIDRGLAHSRFGIVVLSPAFLRRTGPNTN